MPTDRTAPVSPATPDMTAFVRVTGIRGGRFVEFVYGLGDGDLAVELIMPFAAFDEFCIRQRAVVLPSDVVDGVPAGTAGLYHPPSASPDLDGRETA